MAEFQPEGQYAATKHTQLFFRLWSRSIVVGAFWTDTMAYSHTATPSLKTRFIITTSECLAAYYTFECAKPTQTAYSALTFLYQSNNYFNSVVVWLFRGRLLYIIFPASSHCSSETLCVFWIGQLFDIILAQHLNMMRLNNVSM